MHSLDGFVLGQWWTVGRVSCPVHLVLRSRAAPRWPGFAMRGRGGAEATRAGPYMGELGRKNYTGVTSKMTLRKENGMDEIVSVRFTKGALQELVDRINAANLVDDRGWALGVSVGYELDGQAVLWWSMSNPVGADAD